MNSKGTAPATDHAPITQTSGLDNYIDFTWSTAGAKAITVTAANAAGVVTATATVTLYTAVYGGFSAAPLSGTTPLTVTFNSTSSGVSNQWDFGDGTTSDEHSPTHVCATAGSYTVTLAMNSLIGAAVVVSPSLITAYSPVQASFTASPRSGGTPLAVGSKPQRHVHGGR